jgi:hypothetical protein
MTSTSFRIELYLTEPDVLASVDDSAFEPAHESRWAEDGMEFEMIVADVSAADSNDSIANQSDRRDSLRDVDGRF